MYLRSAGYTMKAMLLRIITTGNIAGQYGYIDELQATLLTIWLHRITTGNIVDNMAT